MLTGRRYRCIPQFSHQCSRCAMFLFGNDSYSTQALASRPGNKRRRLVSVSCSLLTLGYPFDRRSAIQELLGLQESGRLASSVSSSSAADSARLVANLPVRLPTAHGQQPGPGLERIPSCLSRYMCRTRNLSSTLTQMLSSLARFASPLLDPSVA